MLCPLIFCHKAENGNKPDLLRGQVERPVGEPGKMTVSIDHGRYMIKGS